MNTAVTILSVFPFLTALLLLVRNKSPFGWITWAPKLLAGAVSTWMCILGFAAAVSGIYLRVPAAIAFGGISFIVSGYYLLRVSSVQADFIRAFGNGWSERIPQSIRPAMHRRRWSLIAPRARGAPRVDRDVPFWIVPASCTSNGQPRTLLCDVWQPPQGVTKSGLAFLYFHGSGWTILDKDLGTRYFFRHLANQGHVIMDVAYRLFPETTMDGMAGDVQRAIAWMKEHSEEYGISPDRIVLGGGSAGGHLSLLAAYSCQEGTFTPEDIRGRDLSVCGVVSEYGPADLSVCYYHTNQDKTTRRLPPGPPEVKPASARPNLMQRLMGSQYTRMHMDSGASSGAFIMILGAHPDERPEVYAKLSPITYAHTACPPTLQIQGEYDLVTPPSAARTLHERLQELGVPSLLVVYPMTDHGFDLALPSISPTAQSALYEVERFLGVLAGW